MTNTTPTDNRPQTADAQIDVQGWLLKLRSFWWLFLLGLIVSIAAGQVYLRFATPLYSTKAKLLIKGVGRSGNLSEASILIEGLGIEGGGKDMDNEIQILLSRPLLTTTVERIRANILYATPGGDKELTEVPVVEASHQLHTDVQRVSYIIKPGADGTFELQTKPGKPDETYRYGQLIENESGIFSFEHNPEAPDQSTAFQVDIMDAEYLAPYYQQALIVEVVGAKGSSSILEIKLIDRSPQKAQAFVNTLIEVYNEAEINDNTVVLKNTLDFINERITAITSELNEVEGDLERFKSENELITKEASGSFDFAITEMRSALAELSSYEVQVELLRALEVDLRGNSNNLIPTNIANGDASLNGLIAEYNSVLLQQKKLNQTLSSESPVIMSSDSRLTDLKNLILVSLHNHQNDLSIPIGKTMGKIRQLKTDLTSVPSVEKQLLEKLRMQSIKENLFLFLLTKKEETELSQAITTANTRIIESARSGGAPVFPQKKLVLIASILLGLFIPVLIVLSLTLLETTVNSEEILKSIVSIPIIGRIPHKKTVGNITILPGERSAVSEMFRFLRTNLNYINLDTDRQVILITSSVSGEGKSMIAINLALTIALSRKKVVVVGMDLRMPKVAQYLEVADSKGVTNYLTGQASLDEIIKTWKDNEHFHYITSGPAPPDPAELIMSDQMEELIAELKKRFDYILLDSPPIVVADAFLLRKYVTNTLFVVREKFTRKSTVRQLEERYKAGELVKPALVFNDIKITKNANSPYYGAGDYLNKQ